MRSISIPAKTDPGAPAELLPAIAPDGSADPLGFRAASLLRITVLLGALLLWPEEAVAVAVLVAIVLWGAFECVQKRRLAQLLDAMVHLHRLACEAADGERRKISLDLHDSAIQPYLGLRMGLEALRRKMAPDNVLARDLDELYRMTQDSIADLRGYVRVLGNGRHGGAAILADALGRQAERFSAFYGIDVEINSLTEVQAEGALVDELARMVGEGLSNIGRHTASRRATITLSRRDGRLLIQIVDHAGGTGPWKPFTPVSLSERARQLGGGVEVMPREGGGSVVNITLPL